MRVQDTDLYYSDDEDYDVGHYKKYRNFEDGVLLESYLLPVTKSDEGTRYHGVNMFNKKGYEVRKQVLDISTLDLMYEYYKLKVENNQFEVDDYQVGPTITMYGDTLNDSLLRWTLPFAQEVIGEELYPCYSFLRIYNGGDTLQPHCDRPSCEFSTNITNTF